MANESSYIGIAMGLDVSDLKAGITEANKQIQLANAKFKAAASEMDDWTKSTDGLKAKISQLDTVLQMQQKKLSGLRAEYEKVAKEQGENSEAARRLEIQINNQQSVVNKTERELKNYRETLQGAENGTIDLENASLRGGKAIQKFGNDSKEAENKLEGLNNISKGIGKAFLALGTAVVGAGTALAASSASAASYADNILTMSTVTGVSTDDLQAFNYAAELVDVSLETLTKSMAKNIKSMSTAADGSKTTSEAYEKLGVKITDANGNLRDGETVYWEAIDALGKMSNETERDAVAMELFGKSAQELNPLIEAGADKMQQLTKEAREVGAVMSEEALGSLGAFDDSMQRLKGSAGAAKNALGTVLLPVLQKVADVGTKKITEFTNELNKGDNAVEEFADTAGNVAETAIDMFAKGIAFVVKNAKPLIATVGTATTVFATFSATMAIANTVTATTTALKGLTAGVGLATKAQTVWNAVMSANPIGAVLTAVGLLTAGIAALVISQKNATKHNDLLNESQRATVTAAKDSAEAYKEAKDEATELAAAQSANLDYTEKLWKELQNLATEQGEVAENDKARAQFIINELNEALGTEYSMTGNIIDNYKSMVKAIQDVITTKRAQMLLETYEDTYRTAIEKTAEAEKARAIQAQELAMQEDVVNRKRQEAAEAEAEMLAQTDARYQAHFRMRWNAKLEELKNEEATLAQKQLAYNASEAELYQYYADIGSYEQAHTLLLAGETQEAIQFLNNLGSGFQTVASTAQLAADEQRKILEQQVIDTEVNAVLMKEAYENGVEGVTEEMVKIAREQADAAKEEFKTVGGDITEGVAEGASGKSWVLNGAMSKLVNGAVAAARQAADAHSPSRRARKEIGLPIGQGAGLGVLDAIPEVKKNMRTFNDYIFANLGKTKSGLRVGIAGNGRSVGGSSVGGSNSTVVNAGMTVNYNGNLSRKQLKQLENDNYVALRTRLIAEGGIL